MLGEDVGETEGADVSPLFAINLRLGVKPGSLIKLIISMLSIVRLGSPKLLKIANFSANKALV